MSTSARPRRALPTRLRPALRGREAGVVLLSGMALVALAVTLAPGVDVHKLHLIHGDGTMVHGIEVEYPGTRLQPQYNPFMADRLRLLTPLLALAYLTSVAALGATFVSAIRGSDRWPVVVRALAGFLPGFLMVLVPLQVLFAAVPLLTAAWIALVGLPLVAVLVQRRAIVAMAGRLRRDEDGARRQALLVVGALVAIVALCAVHRLQGGRYFMVPDSISFLLGAGDQQMGGEFGAYLVQWAQQSDEWVFNAPLLFSARLAHDQQFVFWCTQFVALASFTALIYGVVWSFARRRRVLAGALAAGLILATTPSIYPWDNIVIIGGQNPGLFFAHPGRQVSVLAPWIALLLLGHPSRRAVLAILLVVAGLAFTTLEGAGFAAVALVATGAWRLLSGRGRGLVRTPSTRTAAAVGVHVLAAVALAAPAITYYGVLHTRHPDRYGWVLVGGAVLAVLGVVLLAATQATRPDHAAELRPTKRSSALAAAVVAAFAAGLALSNNMVSGVANGAVRDALSHVLPGYGGPLQARILEGHPRFPQYAGEACVTSGYCLSFGYFLAVYGFTLVLAFAGWVGLGAISEDEDVNRRRAAWLLTVAAFGIALAIVDFTGADFDTAWILTRFVDVPYFAMLAFVAIVFAGARNRFTALTGTAVLAIWTIVPFLHSHVPEQWVRNASWLVARMH
ncbi:hypothetical protein [Baekduia sp. Peel2402]|uniref:hypothetical protein n=1 Tax=Baekduia sp. Peel2402 TaxID=3458296 RepID=UPI00403E7257